MTVDKLFEDIMRDLDVELSDEFDRNFSRGAFFSEVWPPKRDGSPSHLVRSGRLRRSVRSSISGCRIRWTTSEPYAQIHNDGGDIRVTQKMKSYFWAKFYKTKDIRWKRMALKKAGDTIRMPRRRFLGDAPEARRSIERVIDARVKSFLSGGLLK